MAIITLELVVESENFITTWNTEENNESISIFINDEFSDYDFLIDWGDGIIENNMGEDAIHTYDEPGSYTVRISGDFHGFNIGDAENALKLKTIQNWGSIKWKSLKNAFKHAAELTYHCKDVPNLTSVKSTANLFEGCTMLDCDLNNWQMDSIEDISGMFKNCEAFNSPLNEWNVEKVENMNNLFHGAQSFNQPLTDWNTGKVNNMAGLFRNCSVFNQPLNQWNVDLVTTMENMFREASVFNQPLESWDVQSVTNMEFMFNRANQFNQDITAWWTINVTGCLGFGVGSDLTTALMPNYGPCF